MADTTMPSGSHGALNSKYSDLKNASVWYLASMRPGLVLLAAILCFACTGGDDHEECPTNAIPVATGRISSLDGAPLSPEVIELIEFDQGPRGLGTRHVCRLLEPGQYQCFGRGGEPSLLRMELDGSEYSWPIDSEAGDPPCSFPITVYLDVTIPPQE